MPLSITRKDWKAFIEHEKKVHIISSMAIINLNGKKQDDLSAKIAKKYQSLINTSLPEYIKNTIELRSDPRKLFPWAKSIFIAAVPFNRVPNVENFIPEAKNPLFAGKIAGYATRKDYHIFAKELFNSIANDISTFISQYKNEKQDIRIEICVDTMPVAERALAAISNLGKIGKNASLLTHDAGSGCFITELFTDLDVPDVKAHSLNVSCNSCSNCISACQTGALKSKSEFGYALCRSCLTMEKRGILSLNERKILGEWIFGCDDCSSCCPGSKLPKPFDADLKWLLTVDAGEIKRRIKGTAIEYAGVTLLRRNALAVLGNRKSKETLNLIQKFAEKSGSRLLKTTAEEILDVQH